METLESKILALTKKHNEEQAALHTEYWVLGELGELIAGYNPPHVHPYPLYGADGSVKFEPGYYSCLQKGKSPDRDLLKSLLLKYPPQEKILHRAGCLRIMPNLPGNNEDEDKPGVYILDIGRITVDVEVFQQRTASFEWYALISGKLWRFEVQVPLHQTTLGKLDLRPAYYGKSGKIAFYRVCQFFPEDGNCQVIRWAAGAREYPNKFTLYWDTDSGAEVDFPSYIKE